MVGQDPWQRRGEQDAQIAANTIPVGVINAYYGTTAPTGWLLCDGAAIPARYTALIALVGANTPNLKGKVVVGVNAAETEWDVLAETGGAKTVTIASGNLPTHTHTVDHDHANATSTAGSSHDHGLTNHNHGGGTGVHGHTVNSHNHGGGTGVHGHTVQGAWVDGSGTDVGGTNRRRHAVGVNSNNPTTDSVGVGNTFESPGTDSVGQGNTGQGGADASHTHDLNLPNFTGSSGDGGFAGTAITNLQPYIALSYIIKA